MLFEAVVVVAAGDADVVADVVDRSVEVGNALSVHCSLHSGRSKQLEKKK